MDVAARGHLDMVLVAPRAIDRSAALRLPRDADHRSVRTLECFRDNLAARRFCEPVFVGKGHAFMFGEGAA